MTAITLLFVSTGNKSIEATIQESGSYILMAKCYDAIGKSGESTKGYCNIYQIDSETQEKTLLKENAQLGGYRLAITNPVFGSKTYNSFTVNSNTFDSIMYILSENSVSDRKVIGYNDDYRGDGDFYWGLASRVQQSYSTDNTPKYVFVSSYNSTISDTVDIYGMCKGTYSNTNMFPNLKSDDEKLSISSNSCYFTQTLEYEKLSTFIDENDSLECLIVNMYIEDSNAFITTIFNDKIVSKNSNTLKLANDIREKNNKISTDSLNSSTYTAPTYNTNALCFIKEILNDKSYSILK